MQNSSKDIGDFSNDSRVNEILEVIYAFARLEFGKKVTISNNDDILDGIGTGVNMLGEELNYSSVSLKEKEHLLKEIHHRVKNNLQIVSSLLSLQSENIQDPKFLNLIQESKSRINSMALVHEMLYKSNDLSKIELKEYIRRLVDHIQSSFSRKDLVLTFHINVDGNQYLEIDKMIPIGLILNEIISNSFKYAFKNNNQGNISIKIEKQNSHYLLEVSDDGCGFPNDFNFENSNSLGIQLIKMLCEQIDAKMDVISSNGVKYQILFIY